MYILIGILGFLLCFSLVRMSLYRRQITSICRQLSFMKQHETNMIITQKTADKCFTELTNEINDVLEKDRKINQEYEHKDRKLKDTITNLAHDIRTPLTSLDGYVQLLQDCQKKEEQERYFHIVRGRIDSLKDILEELFTYAKLQNDTYELEQEQCDLTMLCYEVLFSFYDEFKQKGAELIIKIPEEHISIRGNISGIRRCLQNIIKNGLLHGENMLEFELKISPLYATVTVWNKMVDSVQVDIDHVFERFYKADEARSTNSAGLGLAIAKEITEKLGGEIRAYKEQDRFCIELKYSIWKNLS